MRLVIPSNEYKQQVLDYRKEFIENGDDLAGTSYLREYDIYEDWLKFVLDNEKNSTKHTEVTANVYLAIREDDNKLVGILNIRHKLNEYLYNYGGHIGYSVRRIERKKGYAKEMLKIALKKCKDINIEDILITCDAENTASIKTVKSCGGTLENKVNNGYNVIYRYWIKL